MRRVNQYSFYQAGFILHNLNSLKPDEPLENMLVTLFSVKRWLAFLLEGRLVPLDVSRPACGKLKECVERILEPDDKKPLIEKTLERYEIERAKDALREFETVFSAELRSLDTYYCSQKLGYDTSVLIEEAEKLIPESIRSSMPENAINDIRQAGKCIAFDIPTAAGFHTIRATEAVIRAYYAVVVGTMPKLKMRNWGAYIKILNESGADKRVDRVLRSYS